MSKLFSTQNWWKCYSINSFGLPGKTELFQQQKKFIRISDWPRVWWGLEMRPPIKMSGLRSWHWRSLTSIPVLGGALLLPLLWKKKIVLYSITAWRMIQPGILPTDIMHIYGEIVKSLVHLGFLQNFSFGGPDGGRSVFHRRGRVDWERRVWAVVPLTMGQRQWQWRRWWCGWWCWRCCRGSRQGARLCLVWNNGQWVEALDGWRWRSVAGTSGSVHTVGVSWRLLSRVVPSVKGPDSTFFRLSLTSTSRSSTSTRRPSASRHASSFCLKLASNEAFCFGSEEKNWLIDWQTKCMRYRKVKENKTQVSWRIPPWTLFFNALR